MPQAAKTYCINKKKKEHEKYKLPDHKNDCLNHFTSLKNDVHHVKQFAFPWICLLFRSFNLSKKDLWSSFTTKVRFCLPATVYKESILVVLLFWTSQVFVWPKCYIYNSLVWSACLKIRSLLIKRWGDFSAVKKVFVCFDENWMLHTNKVYLRQQITRLWSNHDKLG